jgi:hypothetical protein
MLADGRQTVNDFQVGQPIFPGLAAAASGFDTHDHLLPLSITWADPP